MAAEIYCYGGIDIYRDVFNAIAMLNGNQGFIKSLITIGVIVGAFWSMVIMVGGDLVKPFLSWMIPMIIMQTVFLTPTRTVTLIDVVQNRHATVDNVPYGLALIAGSLSRISHQLTQKTEMFFTIPNDMKYSQSGGIFAANLLANQKIMTIQDEDFAENMRSFIGQCVLYDLALGRKYSLKDLRNTNNIWELISRQASPARSFLWKDPQSRGDIITCREGVVKFNQAWGGAIDQTACVIGALLYPNKDQHVSSINGTGSTSSPAAMGCRSPLAKQEFLKFLPIHYAALAGMAGDTSALKQQMMIAALVDAQDHASMMAGNASNLAARKAYLQQRSSYETIGKLASDTLPVMRAVLELICYALFLFIMPLLVLPQGYRVLVSWAQTILWLAMWPPMYAILHLIMVSAISMKTKAYMGISNPAGITLASALGVQNISADMAAMAGYLSMSIPFICIAIVKGVSSFVHMSSSLGGVSQGAASSAATEALTGNYQIGNTSMDNHSFRNISMLREGYNGNLSQGSVSMQDGHVGISSSMDGGSTMNIEQSSLPVSVNMAQSIASNQRMAANQEMSMGTSKMQSAERSFGSAMEQTGTLGQTLSNSTNTQKVFGEMTEQQIGQSMQTASNAVDKLSKDANISKVKAGQIMVSVGSPDLSKMFTGLSAGTNLESSNASQETIVKAKEISKSFNFDENARTAIQATEHLSKTSSDDTIRSLARNQQASFSEAAHENQSAQKHIENSKRLSKEADYTESNSASVNKNYNDKLKDYIAGHKSQNGKDVLGLKEAGAILWKNDAVTQVYVNRFLQEHAPRPTFSADHNTIKQSYESTQLPSIVDSGIVNRFEQQSAQKISNTVNAQAHGIENRIGERFASTNEFIKGAQTDVIDASRAQLQKEHDRQSTDVGVVTAIKGGLKSVKNAAESPINFVSETVDDAKDMYRNIMHGEKKPTDYTHFTETLNTSFGSQTSTDQPTKVIKIKAESVRSEVESIENDSGVVPKNLLKKG